MAESRIVVFAAIAGNVAIATTKFIVAGISGSSAMLSEAIHSTVDTGNDLLLLFGMKLSERKPNAAHPFGYGREQYFWSLIVAVLVFGLGGGMSIYEGLQHMRHPEPLKDPMWNYIVLAASTVFEGISFAIGVREVWKSKGEQGFFTALHNSKDPSTFTVVAEDAAALAGLGLAALGVFASHHFNRPDLDGAASLAIGVLLAGVAILLIYESRGLLIGEGISTDTAHTIRLMALDDATVRAVGYPLSMYLGPEEVLLTLDIEFEDTLSSEEMTASVRRLESAIRARFERIRRIYIESNPVAVHEQAQRLGMQANAA
ncbi:cation diffusion facilitator family transporter [Noviherbaspirillum pedocola]|uniref:Cation transporter n=1 Tax=Noviherbaspirillum pedocola TaxID=2801341 RepID=A0A934T2B9_9BURK|nr:cation diffusion facilitator family transporter [Noviherbaspirillum pedocola]MBK4736553.1 cation transporter [Noviherbaspirillum pedocola]